MTGKIKEGRNEIEAFIDEKSFSNEPKSWQNARTRSKIKRAPSNPWDTFKKYIHIENPFHGIALLIWCGNLQTNHFKEYIKYINKFRMSIIPTKKTLTNTKFITKQYTETEKLGIYSCTKI